MSLGVPPDKSATARAFDLPREEELAADPIRHLVRQLARLPGIGEKTATRLAFFLLRSKNDFPENLAYAILDVRERVVFCSTCCNLSAADPCSLCTDVKRDPAVLCVVAQPPDLLALERAGFRGGYHVLHGVLSPLDGIGPDDLRITPLLARVQTGKLREVILATSPNVEGEATALYLAKLLRPLGVKTSRIASGVPIGGELEYADQVTLSRALEGRHEM